MSKESKIWRIGNVRKFWNDGLGDFDVCDIVEDFLPSLDKTIAECVKVEVAEQIIAARTLAELGQTMREAQRLYFRNRTTENLIASKQAEKAFDDALKAALAKVEP